MESLLRPVCKATVYYNVRADSQQARRLREQWLKQQICRAHVNRNIHDLIAALGQKALEHPDLPPWELSGPVTVDQFIQDLTTLEWIIKSVPTNGQSQLEELAARYQWAPPLPQGGKATMWYRMRLLTLDWSENGLKTTYLVGRA